MEKLAQQTLEILRNKKYTLATAESCTGGGIACTLTGINGSSDVFDRGFVTYSNQSKTDMLNVNEALLNTHGAVSKEVAIAMAKGALKNANVSVSVAVTGIAGPTGGSKLKPVGLVHISVATITNTYHKKYIFTGDRSKIRSQTITKALNMLIKSVS